MGHAALNFKSNTENNTKRNIFGHRTVGCVVWKDCVSQSGKQWPFYIAIDSVPKSPGTG